MKGWFGGSSEKEIISSMNIPEKAPGTWGQEAL